MAGSGPRYAEGMRRPRPPLAALALVLLAGSGRAHCPNWVDCPERLGTGGVWALARSPQFPEALIGVTAGGALWTGDRSRLGRTLWQAVDALAVSAVATTGLKVTFQRARPRQSDNPNVWFSGLHHQSFPSGDVSATAALVTPVLLEYGRDRPWVWPLAALVPFDMVARTRYKAHWWTDVSMGALVGIGSGWWAHTWSAPVIVRLLPGGLRVGLAAHF